jgi:hypothetical protein
MYEMEGASPGRITPGQPVARPSWDAASGGRLPGLPILSQVGQLPVLPGPADRPPVPCTRERYQFPDSSRVPEVASGRYPFPTVKVFLRLPRVPRKGLRQSHANFFAVHMMSTERTQLFAADQGYPPAYAQPFHRSPPVTRRIPRSPSPTVIARSFPATSGNSGRSGGRGHAVRSAWRRLTTSRASPTCWPMLVSELKTCRTVPSRSIT